MRVSRARFVCIAALSASTALAQNGRPVRVRGIVYDSLHNTPLAGAFVVLTPGGLSATSDERGRFVFDSVAPGSYRLIMQHDVLDSIGMSGAASLAAITTGRDTVRVAVPSFATLWDASCHSAPPRADSGFVFGTIRSSGPSAGFAKVTATWIDAGFDRVTGVTTKHWRLESVADSLGNYALCGVPTQTGISVRATTDSGATGAFDLLPLDRERVRRRNLALASAPAALATTKRGATITGTVLVDSLKTPMANVEVSLSDIGLVTMTDAKGAYTIRDVPPGTHTIRARRIGYAASVTNVDFLEGQSIERTILMERVTTLDSINVRASAGPRDLMMEAFAEHVRRGFGSFYDSEALRKREGQSLSSLMQQSLGTHVLPGRASQAWIVGRSSKPFAPMGCTDNPKAGGITAMKMACREGGWYNPDGNERLQGMKFGCYARVYLDHTLLNPYAEPVDLNEYRIPQIEAIEWYASQADTPPEYLSRSAPCGVMVIHTRG